MNAVTLIKADHERVALLYKRYLRMAGDAAEQRALVEQICHALEVHATLEEEIFYPALQARLGHTGTDLVAEAIAEHHDMKHVIQMLRSGALADPDYDSVVRRLMQSVQHHVREEEGEMLPQAEHQLGGDLDRLGAQMQQRQEALLAATPATAAGPQSGTDGRGPGNGASTRPPQKQPTDKNSGGSSTIEASIDVHVPIRTAYNQWTQFEEFPQFMEGIESITQHDDTHLRWQAKVGGKTKAWDAEITEQIPDERIAWANTTGARNAGVVTFHRLADDHTRVMLQMDYEPEGLVENLGDMLGVVSARVRGDLERFKEFIEARGAETGAWRGTVEQPS